VDRRRLPSANSLLHQGQPIAWTAIAAFIASSVQPTSYSHGRPGDRYRWPRRPSSLHLLSQPNGHGRHNRPPTVQMISYHLCCLLTTEAAATTGMAAAPQLQWPRAVLANSGHNRPSAGPHYLLATCWPTYRPPAGHLANISHLLTTTGHLLAYIPATRWPTGRLWPQWPTFWPPNGRHDGRNAGRPPLLTTYY
jgi:hypothetical protein